MEYMRFFKIHFYTLVFQIFYFLLHGSVANPDGCNDFHAGDHNVKDHIKSNLVVTGSCAAMGNRICIQFFCMFSNMQCLANVLRLHLRDRYCFLIHFHKSGI